MSYCVNCGVELAPSEKSCPLCGVEVINPLSTGNEPTSRPYPSRVEKVVNRIDRKYLAGLIGIILLIPITVCLLCDILDGGLSWSLLVSGAVISLFVICIVPIMYKRPQPLLFLLFDTLAICAYLLMIEFASRGAWFLPLGLPIVLCSATLTALLMLWLRKKRPIALTCGFAVLGAGLLSVCINMIVNAFLGLSVFPSWSLYSLLPCLVLFVFFVVLNKRNRWKENIKKRLFI